MWLFLFYCFDDWLARVTETPWLGNVPWVVVLFAAVVMSYLNYRQIVTTVASK